MALGDPIDYQAALQAYQSAPVPEQSLAGDDLAGQLAVPAPPPVDYQAALSGYQGLPVAPVEPVAAPASPPAPVEPVVAPEDPEAGYVPPDVEAEILAEATPDPATFEGAVQQVQDAAAATQASQARVADAQRAAGEERSALRDDRLAALEAETAEFEQRRQEYREDAEGIVAEYRRLNEEIANAKVGDSRTDGQKVLGMLGVAFAGIGDAMVAFGGGRSNHLQNVSDGIDRLVERDIALQREALGRKGKLAQSKLTELSLARQFFGDDASAMEFVAAKRKEAYAEQVGAIADTLGSTVQAEVAQQASEQAKQQSALTVRQLVVQESQRKLRERADRRAAAAARGRGRGKSPSLKDMTPAQLRALKGAGLLSAEGHKILQGLDAKGGSADERKLKRLMAGVAPAAETARAALEEDRTPTFPGVSRLPDAIRSEEQVKLDRSIMALRDVLLRDESGAAIADHEKQTKIDGWGIESTDADIRREGLRRMLIEYDARSGGAPAADYMPSTHQSAPVLRGEAAETARKRWGFKAGR